MTRSTLKAGAMVAGDNIAGDADASLLDLLNFSTTTAGVRVGDLLRERLIPAEAAIERHAAGADDAALAGEAAEQAHAEEAARLEREVRRIRLAIERADAHLAEVAAQERRVAGEAASRRACELAAKIEAKLTGEYVPVARRVGELLAELDALTAELVREHRTAIEAGVPCDAKLPHEARFRPEVSEEREVIVPAARVGVFDMQGNPIGSGGARHFGKPAGEPEPRVTRRRESVVVQHRHAPPNILAVRAVLPDPDGGAIVDRNRD